MPAPPTSDVAWIQHRLASTGFDTTLTVHRDLAMIAAQAPPNRPHRQQKPRLLASKPFRGPPGATSSLPHRLHPVGQIVLTPAERTGCRHLNAPSWPPASPCGLRPRRLAPRGRHGALYGNDMDESTLPLTPASPGPFDFSDAPPATSSARLRLPTEPSRQVLGLVLEDGACAALPPAVFTRPGAKAKPLAAPSRRPRKAICDGRACPSAWRRATTSRWTSRGKRLKRGWLKPLSSALHPTAILFPSQPLPIGLRNQDITMTISHGTPLHRLPRMGPHRIRRQPHHRHHRPRPRAFGDVVLNCPKPALRRRRRRIHRGD